MPLNPESSPFSAFDIGLTIVVVIIALGAVFIVVSIVRNVIKVRASGHDPMTLQSDLAVKLLDSSAFAADKSLSQRFAELDTLLAAGTITPEEHSAARSKLLGSV